MPKALKEYHNLIKDVERGCDRILSRHRGQIACTRGCAGNCCRIHLSLFPVEAVSLATALGKLAPAEREHAFIECVNGHVAASRARCATTGGVIPPYRCDCVDAP